MADKCTIPADCIAAYDKLVARVPGLQRKGAKSKYTSRNGHMFSFLTQEGRLAIRLSKEEQEAFIKKHKAEYVYQHGCMMHGYVLVPDKMFRRPASIGPYFERSHAYIGTLPPKATTKGKKTAKRKVSTKKAAANKTSKKTSKKAAKKKATRKKGAKKAAARKTVRKKSRKVARKKSAK